MIKIITKIKKKLIYILVESNSLIRREYKTYVREHEKEHKDHRYRHWWILIKLNLHYRIEKKQYSFLKNQNQLYYYRNDEKRKSINEICEEVSKYDVISFDIFDTAIYRKVEFPDDVFTIMAIETGHNNFVAIRKRAEQEARELNEKKIGSREVTLDEIYEIIQNYYGIDSKYKNREIELEVELSTVNQYIFEVYKRLIKMDKKIVFTSDMYLPKRVIEDILRKNGYNKYEKIYISNEYKLSKGEGKLQQVLIKDYPNLKVIHIGDNYKSDVKKSIEVGLNAIHNQDSRLLYNEGNLDNLSGSFYRAIINNNLNNGMWDKNLHFEHGFRTGGILATGFCEYINKVVQENKIDKILFCARDCEIIWKIYNKYFNICPNEYIQISRHAILNVTTDMYLYDLADRYILRYIEQNKSTKTIENIFKECGFSYLIPYLEDEDIDKYLFPVAIEKKEIERFIFKYKNIIQEHNKPYVSAAKKYFSSVIGDSKNVLVVDIGWSGTCITALKYFVEKNLPEKECNILGTLMCTSRGKALTTSVSNQEIKSYIYSPYHNLDLARFMMPGGVYEDNKDLLHMPLEFMFSSTEQSLAQYNEDEQGDVVFERMGIPATNIDEIKEMHDGMLHFTEQYMTNTFPYKNMFSVSPYVAFNPLKSSIENKLYTKEVYKNFTYDAFTAPYVETKKAIKFESLFEDNDIQQKDNIKIDKKQKRILFISPELTYTGAPRSLLRMCKVAKELGYQVSVWSSLPGPFVSEFERFNIQVRIVPENELDKRKTIKLIKSYDMAVSNTIVTDKYARACSRYIPTVWYIREATNIPDFIKDKPTREYNLKHSRDIYCVSDYAKKAIQAFTKKKIHVIHNCVEDEVEMATSYVSGTGDKVKFVQFGTMEYRKGYDVLLSAYLSMPKEYQDKAELYFAGGFIRSGAPYCSYLFSRMKNQSNVHYLGVVSGEENKINKLSEMDVIVVASRDESCSLVALEGAMLSKPLIVTENVGAKYIVSKENGIIVNTSDVESMKNAMIYMIDNKKLLKDMGDASRKAYEKYASMASYTEDMKKMFALSKDKKTLKFYLKRKITYWENSFIAKAIERGVKRLVRKAKNYGTKQVIVSLTSHPGRINTVSTCINSLIKQTCKPKKIVLWLSEEQFPQRELELPKDLVKLQDKTNFKIRWVKEDIKPHKKYYYAMQEYPDYPIIIVDDDVIYDNTLVEKLLKSYKKFPGCISCMRANLIMFKSNGKLRKYDAWLKDYKMLLDEPSYWLMPTGVGGVLYPPHSMPKELFDVSEIKENALFTDDLWLKMHAVSNGILTVVPKDSCGYSEIEGTRETALWRINVNQNNNDISINKILDYFKKNGRDDLLEIIRKDRLAL